MTQYGMTTPDGDEVYYSDSIWLQNAILHKYAEFWNSGSGEAVIQHGAKQLLLIFHPRYGFTLTYRDPKDVDFISWVPEASGTNVEVSTGGQPFVLRDNMFVSPELTISVAIQFCQTGDRSGLIQWIRNSDVSWDPSVGIQPR
jgi:hypothetical protein